MTLSVNVYSGKVVKFEHRSYSKVCYYAGHYITYNTSNKPDSPSSEDAIHNLLTISQNLKVSKYVLTTRACD